VRLDVPRRQSSRIERENLVVEPFKAPLTLADDLRSNVPARSLGVLIATSPCSVISVLRVDPFLVFPAPPGGS
jgi:hypothetical protein